MSEIKKAPKAIRLINKRELCERLSASAASIDRWTRSDPSFPQARRLSSGSIRWLEHEIEAFIESLQRAEYEDHGFDPNGG